MKAKVISRSILLLIRHSRTCCMRGRNGECNIITQMAAIGMLKLNQPQETDNYFATSPSSHCGILSCNDKRLPAILPVLKDLSTYKL